MGKKRKVKEISDEDRIQTILVQDPYGYREPDTWDAQDHKRRDEGLYVVVEWLEFIFGGQGGPGSLQAQRKYGPAVEDVWAWTGRMQLLVSIRRDIDITPQLGRHRYSAFLRRPPRGADDTRSAVIKLARYQSSEQIVGMGEGWKSVTSMPFVEVPSIRKHKFVHPYPSPGGPVTSQHATVALVKPEDAKDVKSQVKHEETDSKPARIKQEVKAEAPMSSNSAIHMGGGQADVKPKLAQLSARSSPLAITRDGLSPPLKQEPEASLHLNALPVKVEDASVKEEDVAVMIRRAQARREENRRVILASESSSTAHTSHQRTHTQDLGGIYDFSDQTSQNSRTGLADSGRRSVDLDPRPTKRVKKEEPQ